ncbi:hypothetical protein E2562_018224 [Oryza meyeriana var. granulata]|uniref:Uncharacterized protein n=1 Tax=Oryza meyeriana var. granulata TaxID=110450 RepID=A0A6G1CGL6_9ORYZ|nr:hypothetical protein E2562_018224 [Oryza meyeriana var. granulata]
MVEYVENPCLSLGGDELESQGSSRDSFNGWARSGRGVEDGVGRSGATAAATATATLATVAPVADLVLRQLGVEDGVGQGAQSDSRYSINPSLSSIGPSGDGAWRDDFGTHTPSGLALVEPPTQEDSLITPWLRDQVTLVNMARDQALALSSESLGRRLVVVKGCHGRGALPAVPPLGARPTQNVPRRSPIKPPPHRHLPVAWAGPRFAVR